MKKENLTPKESLQLIAEVIDEARNRFEENGFVFAFWGALIATASTGQFLLLKGGHYSINWYPYLLMPLGAIVTWIYYAKKKKGKPVNLVTRIVAMSWNIIAFNLIVLGFVYGDKLKQNLIPVILILLAVGIWTSAVAVKSKLLYFSAIFVNIAALISFYVERMYQPLLMGAVAFIAVFVPGIILIIQNKQKNV